MKIKVLHFLNTNSYSGAENVAITIINNMNDNYECAYSSLNGQIADVLKRNSIAFFPITKTSISEIRRVVKLYDPDIIHAHDFTTSIICVLSGVSKPIISHLHNNPPWIRKCGIYSFAYLISTIKYKKILTVSDSIGKEYVFSCFINKKLSVVANPIDVNTIVEKSKQSSSVSSKYDIIFLGRLTEQKNPLKFLKLMRKVISDNPNVQVAIIGDGDLKKSCQEKSMELNLTNNVHMLGFLDNPYSILSSSKVLCMTSEWEGFGLVAVEALSLGVPVVATPVGGLPGIVDSNCGLLTNNDEQYVNEVNKLLNNKVYWKEKSNNAIDKSMILNNVKEYTGKLSIIYERILNNNTM